MDIVVLWRSRLPIQVYSPKVATFRAKSLGTKERNLGVTCQEVFFG